MISSFHSWGVVLSVWHRLKSCGMVSHNMGPQFIISLVTMSSPPGDFLSFSFCTASLTSSSMSGLASSFLMGSFFPNLLSANQLHCSICRLSPVLGNAGLWAFLLFSGLSRFFPRFLHLALLGFLFLRSSIGACCLLPWRDSYGDKGPTLAVLFLVMTSLFSFVGRHLYNPWCLFFLFLSSLLCWYKLANRHVLSPLVHPPPLLSSSNAAGSSTFLYLFQSVFMVILKNVWVVFSYVLYLWSSVLIE